MCPQLQDYSREKRALPNLSGEQVPLALPWPRLCTGTDAAQAVTKLSG